MRLKNRFAGVVIPALTAVLCFGPSTAAFAVHDLGNLELDGNTVPDGVEDDWDDVYDDCTNNGCAPTLTAADRQNFTVDSGTDFTVFDGGLKDIQPISDWTCNSSPVQGKSDIEHAYASVYETAGDLVLYAGADRSTVQGTANFGIWLFQDSVGCDSAPNAGGSTPFVGQHFDGDLLLVAEFDQGGSVSTINVYRWSDPDGIPENGDECLGGGLGDCTDEGEFFLQGVNCAASPPGDVVCGTTNDVATVDAAWRAGIGINGFYEAAANLTLAITDQLGCFATSLIETRSSTSLTATLKDFTLLDVSTCGSVEVEKVVSGGSGTFDFSVNPEFETGVGPFAVVGGSSQLFDTVEEGTYTITETGSPSEFWELTGISCTAGQGATDLDAGTVDLTVGLADDIICTFTNAFVPPPGAITIEKTCDSVDDGGQTFDFTLGGFGASSTADCADGSVTLSCGGSITCQQLTAGDYTVGETVPADWDLTDVTCTAGSSTCGSGETPHATINLASEESATASFTNTEAATIAVCKSTVPSAVGGNFSFGGDLGAFALADGECTDDGEADPFEVTPDAPYDVTETVPGGFTLTGLNCTGTNWTANGATVTITPDPGEAVVCTFENTQDPGYIRICKNTVPLAGANPTFEFDQLDTDGSTVLNSTSLQNGECDFGPNDANPIMLPVASGYGVSEDALAGWDTEVSCAGSEGAENPLDIDLAAEEVVTCTFTNTELLIGINIQKTPNLQIIQPGAIAQFEIEVTNIGNVDLENVTVTDANAPGCDAAIGDLAAGADTSYFCSLANVQTPFVNVAVVTGDPVGGGDPVNDSDTASVQFPTEGIPVNGTWALLLLILSIGGIVWYRRPVRS